MVVSIEKAEYLGKFCIKFSFSDGIEQTIDFSEFLQKAKNPMIKKYLDESRFKNYTIKYGDIVWNEYELCFPIWDLHQGRI